MHGGLSNFIRGGEGIGSGFRVGHSAPGRGHRYSQHREPTGPAPKWIVGGDQYGHGFRVPRYQIPPGGYIKNLTGSGRDRRGRLLGDRENLAWNNDGGGTDLRYQAEARDSSSILEENADDYDAFPFILPDEEWRARCGENAIGTAH